MFIYIKGRSSLTIKVPSGCYFKSHFSIHVLAMQKNAVSQADKTRALESSRTCVALVPFVLRFGEAGRSVLSQPRSLLHQEQQLPNACTRSMVLTQRLHAARPNSHSRATPTAGLKASRSAEGHCRREGWIISRRMFLSAYREDNFRQYFANLQFVLQIQIKYICSSMQIFHTVLVYAMLRRTQLSHKITY